MKKLNLKELELKLPKIDENYSKILIGGSYADDFGHGHDLRTPEIIVDPNPVDHDRDGNIDDLFDDGNNYIISDEEGNNNNNNDLNTNLNTIMSLLYDGVDTETMIANNDLFIDMPSGMDIFSDQVSNILSSNSVIAEMIDFLANGDIKLNFTSDTLLPGTIADTGVLNNLIIDIVFNNLFFDANGFVDHNAPNDNIGIDHSVLNNLESLVATIAHEVFHATQTYGYEMAITQAFTPQGQRDYMIDMGYSPSEVAIYFTTTIDSGGIETVTENDPSTFEQNEHDYMQTQDFTYVSDALAEFQAEQALVNSIHDGLEASIQQAQQNLGTSTDPNINQQYQNTFDNLSAQFQSFVNEFGWLITP